jgi:hypothetical protein
MGSLAGKVLSLQRYGKPPTTISWRESKLQANGS